jgi:hypothetical protein
MEDTTEDTKKVVQTTGDGAARAAADLATRAMPSIEGVEQALLEGDLSELTADQRVAYYRKTCESTGLNPLTRPFEYIHLNGDLTLYARKGATDQLRRINGVSITQIEKDYEPDTGLYTVTAYARDEEGRTDVDEGVVSAPGGGDALANARMKAMTKAKRRVTLSICGLGWLDESELDTIPSAEAVDVDHETGEIAEVSTVSDQRERKRYERRLSKLRGRMEDSDTDLKAITDKCFKHAEEKWGWGAEKMEDLEDAARDVQERLGIAPEEVYIPGMGQTDAFEQASEASTEEGGPAEDLSPEAFHEELREALEKRGGQKAKTEAVNDVASKWDPRLGDLTDEERAPYNEVFREALMEAQEETEAEAEASEPQDAGGDAGEEDG